MSHPTLDDKQLSKLILGHALYSLSPHQGYVPRVTLVTTEIKVPAQALLKQPQISIVCVLSQQILSQALSVSQK